MKPDRTPCINPRCRRTAPRDEYPGEMICGKCFRTLPMQIRKEHRSIWREIRKWERRLTRTNDELKRLQMRRILERLGFRLDRNWQRVKAAIEEPERPEGLDAFLEHMGME